MHAPWLHTGRNRPLGVHCLRRDLRGDSGPLRGGSAASASACSRNGQRGSRCRAAACATPPCLADSHPAHLVRHLKAAPAPSPGIHGEAAQCHGQRELSSYFQGTASSESAIVIQFGVNRCLSAKREGRILRILLCELEPARLPTKSCFLFHKGGVRGCLSLWPSPS